MKKNNKKYLKFIKSKQDNIWICKIPLLSDLFMPNSLDPEPESISIKQEDNEYVLYMPDYCWECKSLLEAKNISKREIDKEIKKAKDMLKLLSTYKL